jgi:proline iminopeptidase
MSNLKAAPINRTRTEIYKYPLLAQQADRGYKTTITYGDQDIYKASRNYVIDRYPNAMVYTLHNCGHIPWLHNPVEYYRILLQHFRQASAANHAR